MSSSLPLESYVDEPELCVAKLSECLQDGSLALVLGSGVSAGMGLPVWWKLVKSCVVAAEMADTHAVSDDTSYDDLMKTMSRVEKKLKDQAKYKSLVKSALYESIKDDDALLDQRLLSVIGALTMNSSRGAVSEVLTFNFDDVLERYLDLHGFTSQVITALPEVRKSVDVTVYHPHGFLPSMVGLGTEGKELIFSKLSFDRRLGAQLDPWQELLRDLVQRKFLLFVGLTYGTTTLTTVLADLADKLKPVRGMTGIWIVGPDDPEDSEEELKERNIIPIRMPHEKYPQFLLSICQKAARAHATLE